MENCKKGKFGKQQCLSHYKLDNLIAIIDNNGLQIDGRVTEICSPEPITDKFKSFGWHTILMDAHDFDDIERAFSEAEKLAEACCNHTKVLKVRVYPLWKMKFLGMVKHQMKNNINRR